MRKVNANAPQLWILFVAFAIATSSCHSLVEKDFADYDPKIVLNSTLTSDSLIKVQLTFTANLSDSAPRPIDHALVMVESSTHQRDTLVYVGNGWFQSDLKASKETQYNCWASVTGYEATSAQTTVPARPTILNVTYSKMDGVNNIGEPLSSFQVCFANNPNERLYWELRMIGEGYFDAYDYKKGEFVKEWRTMPNLISMEVGRDSVFIDEANPLTLFSNQHMPNDSHCVKFFFNRSFEIEDGINYSIELRSVSESYYKYHKQLYLYEVAQYEELGSNNQKYPLYSNVTNGLGIFSAFSSVRIPIQIEE